MADIEVPSSLSPMLREYRQTQAQHPGAVVLWRNGEFFEVYFETARLLGAELNLRVKPRPFGREVVDFTGVPLANARDTAHRLLQKGYRVVLVEQVDEQTVPGRPNKKTITRSVARVLTPGTLVELDLLDGRANNYLAAVITHDDRLGLAYCDVSTGEFAATEFGGKRALPRLEGELMRLLPAEILVSEKAEERPGILSTRHGPSTASQDTEGGLEWTRGHITAWPAWHWDYRTTHDALTHQFSVASLAGFGLADLPLATRAAGAIVQYLQATHRTAVTQIDQIRTYHLDAHMLLEPQTQRNLELLAPMGARKRGALIDLLDQTMTAMGARLLRRWVSQPLTDLAPLQHRQDAVTLYVQDTLRRAEIRASLKDVGDVERIANRIIQGVAGIDDLRRLRDSLRALPPVANLVPKGTYGETAGDAELRAPEQGIDICADTLDVLERAVGDAEDTQNGTEGIDMPVIRPGFDSAIDDTITAMRFALRWLRDYEEHERQRTGIKALKVTSNTKLGWFIEIPKTTPAHMIPADYSRKPGSSADERYTTPEMQEYETTWETSRLHLRDLERAALARVLGEIAACGRRLLATARVLAEIDVVATLADVAVRRRYARPVLSETTELRIVNGRHPIVETTVSDAFVPNDTTMDAANAQILVITGPNMAGKSTYLRQVALIVLLAQIGSYVPADAAHIGLVDRIFTRIGAQDDIATGQSTFMVEMTETAHILHSATGRSLLVLDELGRGTSTYDGMSIARAVIECIHSSPRLGCRTLFATHYHELTELAQILPRVHNYHVMVAEHDDQVVFLRKVVPGTADRSYGIHVAQMAGMPRSVVRRAQEVLTVLEAHSDEVRALSGSRPNQETIFDPVPQNQAAGPVHPALLHLKTIQIDELTPLEALTKLYELQALAENAGSPGST